MTQGQPSSYKPLADSEHITTPANVARMLQRFTKHYTPLTAQIPGHKTEYTSSIVDVDKKHVFLDELIPSSGHELLLAEREIRVRGKIEGIDVQFYTTLKRVSDKDNMITYQMKLPSLLEYRQRRQTFRIHIPMAMKLPVVIETGHGEMLIGELHNLSYGGAGMIFLADKSTMETGSSHECAIRLPGEKWVYCTARLCYLKDIASRKTQYIGVQFVDLSSMQSRLIGRFINKLEQDFIRKRASY